MIFRSIFAVLSFISFISCNPLNMFDEDSIMRLNTYTKAVELSASIKRWKYTKQPDLLKMISSGWEELNDKDNVKFFDCSLGSFRTTPTPPKFSQLLVDFEVTPTEGHVVIIDKNIETIEENVDTYFQQIFEHFAQEKLFKRIHELYLECRIVREFLNYFPNSYDFEIQKNYLTDLLPGTFYPKLLDVLKGSEYYESALTIAKVSSGFQPLMSRDESLLDLLDFVFDIHRYTISKLSVQSMEFMIN